MLPVRTRDVRNDFANDLDMDRSAMAFPLLLSRASEGSCSRGRDFVLIPRIALNADNADIESSWLLLPRVKGQDKYRGFRPALRVASKDAYRIGKMVPRLRADPIGKPASPGRG